MKDSYSFDLDEAGLQAAYDKHRAAYIRIFDRLGMDYRIVDADSGAMGGTASEEFLAVAPTGEDTFVSCENCDYAANVEAVTTVVAAAGDDRAPGHGRAGHARARPRSRRSSPGSTSSTSAAPTPPRTR